jgi:hypothetical protein
MGYGRRWATMSTFRMNLADGLSRLVHELSRLIEVKNLYSRFRDRRIILVVRHEIGHVAPPLSAFGSRGNLGPLTLAFDLRVGEKLIRLGNKKDRVIPNAVRP